MKAITKTFKTQNYIYTLSLKEDKKDAGFDILARTISDNTKSYITNINFVISNLLYPIIDIEDYETTIETSLKKAKKIFNLAVKLFQDEDWIKWLEVALEDDKDAGAWEQ